MTAGIERRPVRKQTVETENAPCLPNERPAIFKRGTGMEYNDPHHWHAQWRQRSKQRSRYNKVMSTVGCMFAHNSTTQKHRNWQEGCSFVSRSKSQRSRSTGRLTPWPKISHIFGMGRPTNFKHTDGVQWPYINDMRGGLKGQRSITREGKVAETLKLAGRLSVPRLTFRTSSKIKRSKVKVTGPLLLAVQVTTCRDGDMWRPHYRPHSLYIH